jgi:copper chaperone
MSITLSVPSIMCDACVNTVTKAIANVDPAAKVSADVDKKEVIVETTSSEADVRQAITSAGHTVE